MSKLAYAFEDLAGPELPWIGSLVEPGTIAVDAGSHYGDYTLALARAVGPSGEVWAIDPSPEFMAICRANAALNKFDNIRFLQCGLSDSQGYATFVTDVDPSRSHLAAGEGSERDRVPMDTLDHIHQSLGNNRRVSLVKLDIEGYELAALKGGERLLRTHKPMVLIEMQDAAQERSGSTTSELWAHLSSRGYSFATFGPNGKLIPADGRTPAQANYIAMPTGSGD